MKNISRILHNRRWEPIHRERIKIYVVLKVKVFVERKTGPVPSVLFYNLREYNSCKTLKAK